MSKVRGNYLNDYQPPVAERRPITPSSPPRIRGGKDSVLDKPLADHVRTGVSKLTFEKVVGLWHREYDLPPAYMVL